MARLVREHDWAATPLGPAEGWPQSLRTVAETLLACEFPTIALWGPELAQVYNDGYREIMAAKHPEGLGQPTRGCWPEVWHINAPIYERVLDGETLTFEDKPFSITRRGYPEEAWFTLSYSPLRDEGGGISGVLVTVFEVTARHSAKAALEESETRYRAFVTASYDVVYRMGPDWSEMRELDGRGFISDTTEPNEDWMEHYIHPDDRPLVGARIREAVRTGSVFELEHRVVRVDGTLGWTLSRAVPIFGADGEVLEWLGTASDVTERRRVEAALRESEERKKVEAALRESEERQAFLLELGDAMRAEPGVSGKIGVAARLLGERLGASRFLFAEFDEAAGIADVFHGWFADGAEPFPAVMRLEDYEGPILDELRAGRTVRVNDAGSPPHEQPDLAAVAELGVQALLSVPLIVDGRLKVNVSVHQDEPRRWADGEVALVREAAERLWADVARARAEDALRESEEKYRTLFDSIDEGLAVVEMIYDDRGDIVDMVFRQTNGAYERQGGIYDVVGRSVSEMLPGVESIWLDRYEQVARTGEAIRVEDYQQDVDRWFDVYFSRVDEDGRFVAIVFNDITERKRAEEEHVRRREREVAVSVEAAERERISRELHDRVAHHMGVAHQSLELFSALRETAPGRADEKLVLARETTRHALDQTRAISAELKRLQAEELEDGLGAALNALAETLSDGCGVDVSVSGEDSGVPGPVALQAYLAMREAVRNAVRHSGCSRVGVALEVTDGEVVGLVEDDGAGFDPAAVGSATPSWGVGLTSMRERVELLGGVFRVDSAPGEGTRIELRVPTEIPDTRQR